MSESLLNDRKHIIFQNGKDELLGAPGIGARTHLRQHGGDLEKGVCSEISKSADGNAGPVV